MFQQIFPWPPLLTCCIGWNLMGLGCFLLRPLCLTCFHRLLWSKSRIFWCWWCLWTGPRASSHPDNHWHKARDDRNQQQSWYRRDEFSVFPAGWLCLDISRCSVKRKHAVAASSGEAEDPLACVSFTAKRCCCWQGALRSLFPWCCRTARSLIKQVHHTD